MHATRRIDGEVRLGPNAVLALARERYRRAAFARDDARDLLRFPGTWRIAQRWWRVGALEQLAFVHACRRFLPELSTSDVRWAPSVSALSSSDATERWSTTSWSRFMVQETEPILHVRNAPSTAALAIGSEVARRAVAMLDR